MATSAWLWVCALAAAQTTPVALTVPDGRLVPGTTNAVHVAVAAALDPPDVSSSSGPVRLAGEVATGVWELAVPVPVDAHQVDMTVRVAGRPWVFPLDVWVPSESSLEVPRRVEGVAGGGDISFDVRGEDLPTPESLQVVMGEGKLVSVVPVDDVLRVTIRPDESPFPRHIAVGVRDRRFRDRPAWGGVRLRARPTLPLESEPGSTVTVYVGEREYGPVTVGDDGKVDVRVDQYPEETIASAIFQDDLGNQTRTEIPLARKHGAQLVVLESGDIIPGEPAPTLFLAGIQANGYPWRGQAPSCRTAAADLAVRELSRGQWMVALPSASQVDDIRVDCDLETDLSVRHRVQVARGIPARLGLRVWPTDLRSDFPFAELRVVLEDHRGDRLEVGSVTVRADQGVVEGLVRSRSELEAEYNGTAAADLQTDRVVATWSAPDEGALPDSVQLGWEVIPRTGVARLDARVIDPWRRPVPGVTVFLDAGAETVEVVSGPDGTASAEVPVSTGATPVVLSARLDGRSTHRVALRGQPGRPLESAGLEASAQLSLRPGRIAGLSVQVEPQVLRAAPGALAWVYVDLEDHAGNPIDDEEISLSATEGYISGIRARPDGTLVAEYIPLPSERPREVEITAEADTMRSSTRLSIAPRPVRLTLGAWGGVQTNFGSVTAPVFGLDGDLRVRSRLAGESLMLRLGLARYQFSAQVSTGSGADAVLRSSVYPMTAAVLFRRDTGRFGLWAGAGGVVGIQDLSVRFGADDVGRGLRALGGPTLVGGGGVRALGGELLLTAQASWLPVDAGDVGFSGNIGGLASGAGYRLVF